jgi:hypothetical protein
MLKPDRHLLSILWTVAAALLLLSMFVRYPLFLAAVVGVLGMACGSAALWRRRELRRLNRWIDDRCEGCGYSLRGLGRSGRCPECGKAFKELGVDARGVPA